MYINRNKKAKGSYRKSHSIINQIELNTVHFPDNLENKPYCYIHIPRTEEFMNGEKTPNYILKQITQALVDCTNHLYDIKPKELPFCKVLLVVDFNDILDSQIVIFFDEDYYKSFFIRESDSQRWSILQNECQTINLWSIHIPEHFSVRGYAEQMIDGDYIYNGELWFIGELE